VLFDELSVEAHTLPFPARFFDAIVSIDSYRSAVTTFSFCSAEWRRRHWERSGVVDVDVADLHPSGWDLWYRWCEVAAAWSGTDPAEAGDANLLLTESGRALTFARVVAHTR
jgi:hypothetical protein